MKRYRKLTSLFLGFSVLLITNSCQEKWDDPMPEGASIAISTLFSDLTEEGAILLQWGI